MSSLHALIVWSDRILFSDIGIVLDGKASCSVVGSHLLRGALIKKNRPGGEPGGVGMCVGGSVAASDLLVQPDEDEAEDGEGEGQQVLEALDPAVPQCLMLVVDVDRLGHGTSGVLTGWWSQSVISSPV